MEPEGTQEPEEETSIDTIPSSYACAVTISINPQITLYLDENNLTIGASFDNEDAIDAYSELTLIGTSFEENINLLVDTSIEKGYLKEEGTISFELAQIGDASVVTDDTILQTATQTLEAHFEELLSNAELEDSDEAGDETDDEATKASYQITSAVSEEVTETYHIEKTKITCTSCNGTGIFCPGDPDFGKSRGNGNGYAGCGGTGTCPCPDINCNGGMYTDPNCGGSGKQMCFGCRGTGLNPTDGTTCSYCSGTGKDKCEYCNGKGTYPHHEFCMGTGTSECITMELHTDCPTCGGSGVVEY